MLSKISKRARWVLASCAVVTTTSAGCRNSMPGMNMFGWNRTPSAETLAGSGPTTTYPAPPSASASPEAIASVAGGTADKSDDPVTKPAATENASPAERVASLGERPSYATTASATTGESGASPASTASAGLRSSSAEPSAAPNMAAARANGVLGKMQSAGAAAPSYAQPASATSSSSGYQFGQRGGDAKASPDSASGTGYTLPASLGAPKPSAEKADAASDAGAEKTSRGGSGGYTLPADMTPSSSEPSAKTAGESSAPTEDASSESSTPDAAASPSYSTATQPGASDVPAAAAPSRSSGGSGGYQPGSTGGAAGYPSGSYNAPSPSGGSFYR